MSQSTQPTCSLDLSVRYPTDVDPFLIVELRKPLAGSSNQFATSITSIPDAVETLMTAITSVHAQVQAMYTAGSLSTKDAIKAEIQSSMDSAMANNGIRDLMPNLTIDIFETGFPEEKVAAYSRKYDPHAFNISVRLPTDKYPFVGVGVTDSQIPDALRTRPDTKARLGPALDDIASQATQRYAARQVSFDRIKSTVQSLVNAKLSDIFPGEQFEVKHVVDINISEDLLEATAAAKEAGETAVSFSGQLSASTGSAATFTTSTSGARLTQAERLRRLLNDENF